MRTLLRLLLPLVLCSFATSPAAAEDDVVIFTNVSDVDLYLQVQPSSDAESCLDDSGYLQPIALPAGTEQEVPLESAPMVCWCAVDSESVRDTCTYPETARPGEVVEVDGPESG